MLKVLVADDDQGLRLSVRAALQSTGRFEVDEGRLHRVLPRVRQLHR